MISKGEPETYGKQVFGVWNIHIIWSNFALIDGCLEFNQMCISKQILLFLPKRNKIQITKSLFFTTL